MTYQSRVLLLFCLLLSIEHFTFAAAVNRLVISPVASDSEGLAVDSQGSVIHMLRSSTLNQFTITKTDADGDLVSAFGTGGVVTLNFIAHADVSSGTTVRSVGFTGLDRTQASYMGVDSSNRILLAVNLQFTANRSIAIIRLNAATGQLDGTYGAGGVIMMGGISTDFKLQNLAIDSTGNAITPLWNQSTSLASVIRFAANGSGSEYFSIVAGVVSSVAPGISVTTDPSYNVYVAGRSGADGFCVKLSALDLTVVSGFGTAGKYSATLGLDASSFVYVAATGTNVYLLTLHGNDTNINLRTLSSAGGLSANQNGIFPSPVVLKSAVRATNGKFYLGGTINSGGQTAFWSRFTPNAGNLDNDSGFADNADSNFIANGIMKVSATSGATVASGAGGLLAYNAARNMVAVGFKQTLSDGTTVQFVRDFGTEAGHFLAGPTAVPAPAGTVGNARIQPQNGGKIDRGFKRNTLGGSNVSAIQDAGVLVNADDDVITYFRSGDNFVLSMTNETDGSLATGFASSGSRLIKVRGVGGGDSTAAITNFSGITANKSAYIAYDSRVDNGKIVMAFQVNLSTGNKQIVVIRLDKTTGLLDSGFGSSGVATITDSNLVHQLDALAVDSTGRVVVLTYREDGTGNEFPVVYRFTDNGSLDGAFGTSGVKDLGSSTPNVNNAIAGLDLALNSGDDIFVAGKYGNSSPYGFFCIKLNASNGAINTDFGEGDGIYNRNSITELTTTSRVFCKFQYDQDGGDSVHNLKIFSQGTFSGAAGIVMVKLDLDNNGQETSKFAGTTSTPGIVGFVAITNLTKLNQFLRNNDKRDVCTGTITDVGTVKIFIASITSSGTLNTNYGDTVNDSKTGITILTATGGTIQDGGWASRDSGNAAPIVWIEQDGGTRRLILERTSTDDTFEPATVTSAASATDLVKHEQSYMLDASRLYAHLGIARHLIELRKALDADQSVHLTKVVKDRAVQLFDQTIKTILADKVSSASSNGLKSCHAEKHKSGSMDKKMHAVTKSSSNFTSNEQTALAPHIAARMTAIFGQLDITRKRITDKQS